MKKIIDLEEAIEHLESNVVMMTDYDDGIRGCDIRELLEELPLIKPEPKMGKWKCSDDMYETAICSCCGYDTNEPWGWTREHFMFCPNCGEKLVR